MQNICDRLEAFTIIISENLLFKMYENIVVLLKDFILIVNYLICINFLNPLLLFVITLL